MPHIQKDQTSGKNGKMQNAVCPCTESCPIGEAVRMVGGRWKMRILCSLTVDGTLRYNDIKKKTAGITPAVLSSSMKELERDGLVRRVQYEEIPPRVEYTITEHGRELWPIIHRLAHWARNEGTEEETV
jgi:DNA-binding HxlR family transcriptional regulator